MTLIDNLRADLYVDEGKRKSAYKDSRGYWTIGIGRCIDSRLNAGLSDSEIELLLNNDIARTISLCESQSWYKLLDTDNRRRACLNMVFNLGLGGFLKLDVFVGLLKQQKFSEAAGDLTTTLWYTQTGDRAKRVVDLIRGG